MWDDNAHTSISLTYRSYDDDGNQTACVERALHGDDTEYLPNILREFMFFLHGMTFTYINEVVAHSDNSEHSSHDEADTF